MIHLFTSHGQLHIDGHKDLSKDEPIQTITPEKVYIQATDNRGAALLNPVAVGTKVKKGSLLGVRNDFQLPVYSSVSGEVTQIVKCTSLTVGRPVDFFEITLDGKNVEEKLQPLDGSTKEAVVNKLKEGGIVGLGGAGFPSYIKYNTNDPIDTILINAVECEPYLTTDYVEGIARVDDAFLALPSLIAAVGAKQVVFATKKDKVPLCNAIEEAIERNGASSYAKLVRVKDVYPMGWEKTLIQAALHRTYEGLPSKCGVIVNNLQTVMAIGRLFKDGEVVTTKVFTVSGEVGKPGNYLAPYGIMIGDLVRSAGGYSTEVVAVLPGGPMTSKPIQNDNVPTGLATSGVTVLSGVPEFETEPCLRCGACTDHCPANLQPVEIKDAASNLNVEKATKLKADACVECGLCSYICPSHIQVTEAVAKMKMLIKLKAPKK